MFTKKGKKKTSSLSNNLFTVPCLMIRLLCFEDFSDTETEEGSEMETATEWDVEGMLVQKMFGTIKIETHGKEKPVHGLVFNTSLDLNNDQRSSNNFWATTHL